MCFCFKYSPLTGSIWYPASFLELTMPSSSSLRFYQCTKGVEVFSSVTKTPVSPAHVCSGNIRWSLAPLLSLLAKDSLPAIEQVARLCSCSYLLAGPKPQAAPCPSLMGENRAALEPPAMVNPQDTFLGCKHVRESFRAINLLLFVSAAPKRATQIPQMCSTQGRFIPTACLALKSRITREEQKGLQLLLLLHLSQGGQVSPGNPVTTTELSSAQH